MRPISKLKNKLILEEISSLERSRQEMFMYVAGRLMREYETSHLKIFKQEATKIINSLLVDVELQAIKARR